MFLRVCSAVRARLAVSSCTQSALALALIESPTTGLAAQDQSKSRQCYIPQHPDRSHPMPSMTVLKHNWQSRRRRRRCPLLCCLDPSHSQRNCDPLHHPLRVSFGDDRGGNNVRVNRQCSGNLHATWDNCLVLYAIGPDAADAATALLAAITPEARTRWAASEPPDWANESFAISEAVKTGYCVMHGVRRCCRQRADRRRLPGCERACFERAIAEGRRAPRSNP